MCSPSQSRITNSASDQKLYSTYVCLVNDIKPDFDKKNTNKRSTISIHSTDPAVGFSDETDHEEETIKVERTKAFHELKEMDDNTIQDNIVTTDNDESELDGNLFLSCENSHVLQMTRMKWLTDGHNGSPNASSPSLSPIMSTSSFCSMDSDDHYSKKNIDEDRHLSTILRLDREHNLFGLSNIAIVGAKPSKKSRKETEKPVFPQTAIVQVCCGTGCCKHKSNTDLPCSLKTGCSSCMVPCGGCGSCGACGFFACSKGSCRVCLGVGCSACGAEPCCKEKKCSDCANCYGMKITVNDKPKYEQEPCELTPRSSCVLSKPYAARTCTHDPKCEPPSPFFPYLMPCFWPSRPSAPCSTPAFCFHNPPCPAPRPHRSCSVVEKCPKKCCDGGKKCVNKLCIGNNPATKEAFEKRFGPNSLHKTSTHDHKTNKTNKTHEAVHHK